MPKIFAYLATKAITLAYLMVTIFIFSLFSQNTANAVANNNLANLTNSQRVTQGLTALSWNSLLASSAQLKSDDMCANQYWAHTAPNGTTAWNLYDQVGYKYVTAGENLAKGYFSDIAVINGWMASPGHKANMLKPEFAEIGVAQTTCDFNGINTVIVVAHYGARHTVKQSSKPAPVPVKPSVSLPKQNVSREQTNKVTTNKPPATTLVDIKELVVSPTEKPITEQMNYFKLLLTNVLTKEYNKKVVMA